MTFLGQVVGSCVGCGEPIRNTDARVSAHGPLDYAKYIGGGEYDVLLKQAGYVPDGRYGHGGAWEEPRLLHLGCAPSEVRAYWEAERCKAGIEEPRRGASPELVEAYRRVGVLD